MSALARMPEIDLIPADYRHERALVRVVRNVGIVVLGLVCSAAALSGALRHTVVDTRAEVQRLDAAASMVDLQRTTIAGLAQRKDALQSEVALLQGLRRGAALDELLATVTRAAPAGALWFLSWQFERLGAVVALASTGAENYFVVDAERAAQGPPAVRMQMTIAGQARDHAAVSAFVSSLLEEPGIRDVRVQRASREQSDDLVDFDVLVVADSASATE